MSLETLTCIFLNINSKVNIHFTQKRKVLQKIFFKSFVENSLHLIAIKILLTRILYSHTNTNIVSILSVDVRICVEYEYTNFLNTITSVCEGVMHWTNLFFVFVCLAAKASGDLCCYLGRSLFIHIYIRVLSKFSCIVVYSY